MNFGVYSSGEEVRRRSVAVEQCAVLFIRSGGKDDGQIKALRSLGFRVVESDDLPATEEFASYHAIVVRAKDDCPLPMLAARIRAKPRFNHRVLIALVSDGTTVRSKRDAVVSGFDLTLPEHASARVLAANILRLLRPYPEYRCLLRAPNGRRKAA
jgi:hypothetical protein